MLWKLILLGMVIACVASAAHARGKWMERCGQHIHSTPVQEWRGGNAPPVKMPEGCH